MFAIFLNALAVIVGSAIGALARPRLNPKYINVLNTAMGLAALVLGVQVALENMNKTQYPVLFIFCLSLGGLLGTVLHLDERMVKATQRISSSNLSEGILAGVLLCCIGTLSMMGPVMSALYGDDTYLMTAATLNLVTMIVIASQYGFGVALTAIVVFAWQGGIFLLAKVSQTFISEELVGEVCLVGGILISAAGLGILNIKDCKTINLLPALLMPFLFYLALHLIR